MYLHIRNKKHVGDHVLACGLSKRAEDILFYSHIFYDKFLLFCTQ